MVSLLFLFEQDSDNSIRFMLSIIISSLQLMNDLHFHIISMSVELVLAWPIEMNLLGFVPELYAILVSDYLYVSQVLYVNDNLSIVAISFVTVHVYWLIVELNAQVRVILRISLVNVNR